MLQRQSLEPEFGKEIIMKKSIIARRTASLLLSIVFLMSTVYMVGFNGAVQAESTGSTVGIIASGGTTVYGGSKAVVVDSEIIINTSDFSRVKVSIADPQNSGDVLGYDTSRLPAGVTGSSSNTSNILTFTKPFSTVISEDKWKALFSTVTFNTTSTSDVSRSITFSLVSDTPFMVGNFNHYYQYISQNTANWTAAKDSAENLKFLGMTGYLATITSSDENDFIKNNKLPLSGAWIGASDSVSEGQWEWVTGPETGTLFSNGPFAVLGKYMNWNFLEPNNVDGEDYAQILGTNDNVGKWNDLSNSSIYKGISGYVVEYGGMGGDPTVRLSDSKTIDIVFDIFNINYNLDVLKGEKFSSPPPENYTKISNTITLGTPQKTGYTFAGWYDNAGGNGEKITQITNGSTGDKSLYATWIANNNTPYKVERYQQAVNGTDYIIADTDVFPGVTDSTITASAKTYTGFTLTPGSITTGKISADGLLVLKLYYDRDQFVVTFVDQDGSILKVDKVLYQGTATPPSPSPTKAGYTCTGWSGTYANVTSNQTLTPIFAPNLDTQYKVEHYQQAVNGTDYIIADTDVLPGTTDTEALATANSYTGFTLNTKQAGTKTNGIILPDGTLVLALYYDRNQVTVTFEDYSGTELSKEIVRYGGTVTPVTDPTRTGYMFAGWYKESAAANAWNFDTDTVSTNVTLFAKWTINSYSVTFQDWDGTVISNQIIVHGTDAISPVNPVRSGYTFAAWSLPFTGVTGNIITIAVYTQNPAPTATATPTPTPATDVLGANRATATPAATTAPTDVPSTGVLGAAKTGETGNQNMITAGLVLLAAFAVAGTVFVLRRKHIKD